MYDNTIYTATLQIRRVEAKLENLYWGSGRPPEHLEEERRILQELADAKLGLAIREILLNSPGLTEKDCRGLVYLLVDRAGLIDECQDLLGMRDIP